ncbi:MAG: hypothetical protein SEPTF4163_006582 [Sporothrix epigloea]
MFSTIKLVKALPLAFMLSTAFSSPFPEASFTSDLEERIIGNDATFLICVNADWQCGYYATYTNGNTRKSVSWTAGDHSSNTRVGFSNMDLCAAEGYKKHTKDGFWFNADFHGDDVSHTIGYNPTGKKISLGNPSWKSFDGGYLSGRCLNEFGKDFKNAIPDYGAAELNWNDISQTLY